MAAVTSSPRVRFFIFLYESGLVLKIVIEKYLFGAPFSPFISFFNFEHFPPKKSIKNTRPKTVAAVTRSPRVRFHLTFVWKMSIHHIFYFSKLRLHARTTHVLSFLHVQDLAHSSQFIHTPNHARRAGTLLVLSFASHSLHPPSSFLSCIGWQNGSHLPLTHSILHPLSSHVSVFPHGSH